MYLFPNSFYKIMIIMSVSNLSQFHGKCFYILLCISTLLTLSTKGIFVICLPKGGWLPCLLDYHYKASDSYDFGTRGYV